ncbi:unnamed protein product [Durusdinium trenchii]|uniref:Uncharacterized protein n=1 Tax=Durusdinium trenchii TaxID=1381693 RepID=A0ABP0M5F7_9DINO
MSMDPTMRNAMAGEEGADRTQGSAYWAFMNWTPGSVPVWRICGVVLESKAAEWVGEQRRSALQIRPAAEGFAKGELCMAMAPWRELNAVNAEQLKKVPEGISPAAAFSCLELVAQTGYCGAKFVARPKPGDVAYVSGAAGATGLIACQTFKQLGALEVRGWPFVKVQIHPNS